MKFRLIEFITDAVYQNYLDNPKDWIAINKLECCPTKNPKLYIDFKSAPYIPQTVYINKNQDSPNYGKIISTKNKCEIGINSQRFVWNGKSVSKALIIKSLEWTLTPYNHRKYSNYNSYNQKELKTSLADSNDILINEYLEAGDYENSAIWDKICKERVDLNNKHLNNSPIDKVSITDSNKIYHWCCHKCHYIYQTSGYNRVRSIDSCPVCKSHNGKATSLPEKIVQYYINKTLSGKYEISNNNRSILYNPNTKRFLELDVYIKDLNKAIEYDTDYTHQDFNRDNNKNNIALNNKIQLYRIKGIGDKSYINKPIVAKELNDGCICFEYYINSDKLFIEAMNKCFIYAFNIECDFSDFKEVKTQILNNMR